MVKFLGLAGKKGVGKDEAARVLAVKLNQEGIATSITHFADPLKRLCHDIFGIPNELLWGSDEDKNTLTSVPKPIVGWGKSSEQAEFFTVRELLQYIGTDLFRNQLQSEVWANTPFVADWKSQDLVIIADVRFPNEVEKIREHGGAVFNIRRSGITTSSHLSEIALDNYQFDEHNIYMNTGTLQELHNWVYNKTRLSFPELF